MMDIVGIGCDFVQCERIQKAWKKESFAKKFYTEKEIALVRKRPGRAATNYAAKEAVSKVFGTGFSVFLPIDIEILRDEKGAPYVILHGEAKKKADSLGIKKIMLSLSDDGAYAQAFAMGIKCGD